MKKLMIAAAIVCAAVAAQAETAWTFVIDNFNDRSGESYYSGYATLYAYLADEGESSAQEIYPDAEVNGGRTYTFFQTEMLASETEYTFYFTAEDADGYTFKANPITMEWYGGLTEVYFDYPTGSATWNAPEPTSALLMLLGMAGLALKRKRA